MVDQATPLVEAVLGGNTNQFLNAKSLLLAVRTLVGAAKRKATPDPLIDALRAIAATGHGFAGSLVAWYEKHGSLTANQQGAAERLVAEQARKAQAPQAPAFQPVPVVAVGLYRDDNDGTIRRIYKTGRGRLGCRRYNGVQFVYEGTPGLRLVAAGLDAGTTRLLNAVEASAFGKGIGRCFNCLSIGRPGRLSDDRSLAVGYGPDCAEHNGWWYPTADEAGQILRGTMDLDLKLTMSLSQGTTLSAAPSDSEVAAVVEGLERGDTLAGAELDDADLYIEEDEELSEALDAAAGTTTNCPECGSTDLATDAGPLTVCRSCDWTSWPAPLCLVWTTNRPCVTTAARTSTLPRLWQSVLSRWWASLAPRTIATSRLCSMMTRGAPGLSPQSRQRPLWSRLSAPGATRRLARCRSSVRTLRPSRCALRAVRCSLLATAAPSTRDPPPASPPGSVR